MAQEPAQFGVFDFGLTDAQEERAKNLHRESLIIDMVQQGAGGYRIYEEEPFRSRIEALRKDKTGLELLFALGQTLPYQEDLAGRAPVMYERWRASGITGAPIGINFDDAWYMAANTLLSDRLPWFTRALKADDFVKAKDNGHVAFYGYCQPVGGLPRDLSLIEKGYWFGLRALMLTYNNADFVGAGCTELSDRGLSRFGVSLVQLLNELGVLVDTSHCGPRTTLDACRVSKRTVIANHASAKAVYSHARAKSDDELRAIADTGGVIGVNCVPFLISDHPRADLNHMLNHVDYIAELVGWEHVGIGTDYPMQAPKSLLNTIFSRSELDKIGFRPEDNVVPEHFLIGYDDARDFPNFTRGLVKRGYSDEQVAGIVGGNFLRVFRQVCG